eukprot:m.88351 g.88351  ORF g.88351 m.88351 type:complete len:392 (-) comp13161_c0_seq3:190-1365(-)
MAFVKRYWKRVVGVSVVVGGIGNMIYNRYLSANERHELCLRAMAVGDQAISESNKTVNIHVVASTKSGKANVRSLFEEELRSIFHLAAIDYDIVVETNFAGDAKEQMENLDIAKYNGICVIGGDGLLQEVVTGLMRRQDKNNVEKFPIAHIPIGVSNMLAEALHTNKSHTTTSKLGRACLSIAENKTKKVDVMQVSNKEGQTVYGVSCVGWGLTADAMSQAEDCGTLGSLKYWYGVVSTAAQSFPIVRKASLSYKEDPESSWKRTEINVSELLASNVPKISFGAVSPDASIDDGKISLSLVPASYGQDTKSLFHAGFLLSKGGSLHQLPGVKTTRVSELCFYPHDVESDKSPSTQISSGKSPLNVDGEVLPISEMIHIKVLPRALTFFAQD